MVTLKKSKTRSERRAEVVKKITTNKENARAFLVRAGIVNKSGTLNKICLLYTSPSPRDTR